MQQKLQLTEGKRQDDAGCEVSSHLQQCRAGGSRSGGVRVPVLGHGRRLLDITGMRLLVFLLLDRVLHMEGDVVCSLQKQVLLRKGTLLDIGLSEAIYESDLQHNIEGQHGETGVVPGDQVRCAEVAVGGQLPVHRCVCTKQLAF